jgi:hypothetical protein
MNTPGKPTVESSLEESLGKPDGGQCFISYLANACYTVHNTEAQLPRPAHPTVESYLSLQHTRRHLTRHQAVFDAN